MTIKKGKETLRLGKYAGKWVAFVDRRVVAFGETLQGLMQEMKKRGLEKEASVFLVPRKDEGPYILANQ